MADRRSATGGDDQRKGLWLYHVIEPETWPRVVARRNWSDTKIARELGMEPDEVLRLKQISGLAELFADREFSEALEVK